MSKRNITTKQQFLEILHSTPKSEEEIQQEEEKRNFQILKKLHKTVGERIAILEAAHEDHQSEEVHRIAVGMLDIDLHKEMRYVERMIEDKRRQHDLFYNTYIQMEKRERHREERKRHLVEKLGSKDAAKVIGSMGMNKQDEERDEKRKQLKKKLSIA